MKTLRLELRPDAAETLTARGEISERLLDELAGYLQLTTSDTPPTASVPAVELADGGPPSDTGRWQPWTGWYEFPGRMEYAPESRRLRVRVEPGNRPNAETRLRILRRVLYFALLRRAETGDGALLHGALLTEPDATEGVVLFAESGMGKTTAAARMVRQGGISLADDRMLLTFAPTGEVTARPLPTWSRFPAMPPVAYAAPVRVSGMLMLYRGTDDAIVPALRHNWRIALCRSLADAATSPRDWLPPELRKCWIEKSLAFMGVLERRFGVRQLDGDPAGKIRDRLQEFFTR